MKFPFNRLCKKKLILVSSVGVTALTAALLILNTKFVNKHHAADQKLPAKQLHAFNANIRMLPAKSDRVPHHGRLSTKSYDVKGTKGNRPSVTVLDGKHWDFSKTEKKADTNNSYLGRLYNASEPVSGNAIMDSMMDGSQGKRESEHTNMMDIPQTTMSLDPNLIVTCRETTYVLCHKQSLHEDSNVNYTYDRIFRIALLQRPFWMKLERFNFNNCEYKGCQFHGAQVTEETDVVVVHLVHLKDTLEIPNRRPGQIYIAFDMEPPPAVHAQFQKDPNSHWNRAFNLTANYRQDSDLFVPYGRIQFDPKPLQERPNYYEMAMSRQKSVAWAVSHCQSSGRREDYIKRMMKHIDIDIYGECGEHSCPDTYGDGDDYDCMDDFQHYYKFYLSFESSFCDNYVSEKMFRLFRPGNYLIPVVRGYVNYKEYFPDMTYIDAADFNSPEELALFLKDLASDPIRVAKYLEYKDLYKFAKDPLVYMGCDLCRYLHTHEIEPQVYDLKYWLNDGHCYPAPDLD